MTDTPGLAALKALHHQLRLLNRSGLQPNHRPTDNLPGAHTMQPTDGTPKPNPDRPRRIVDLRPFPNLPHPIGLNLTRTELAAAVHPDADWLTDSYGYTWADRPRRLEAGPPPPHPLDVPATPGLDPDQPTQTQRNIANAIALQLRIRTDAAAISASIANAIHDARTLERLAATTDPNFPEPDPTIPHTGRLGTYLLQPTTDPAGTVEIWIKP